MRRAAVVVAVVVLAVLGYAALDVYDVVPGVLTLAHAPDPAPQAADAPVPSGAATSTVPQPRATSVGPPLVAAGRQQPVPTGAGLQAALAAPLADPALAGQLGLTVRDAVTGTHLLDRGADDSMLPASNLKLLSAAAVAAAFPAGATLTTKVVQGPAANQVVLVAGGDTLLAPGAGDPSAVVGRAGLGDLVTAAADALHARGVAAATVSLDLTYAPGPLLAPTWGPGFRPTGVTGAVAMLGLGSQRVVPGQPGPVDPAASVAGAFVAGLTAKGVAATLAAPATAPSGAALLASVTSAPVLDQLELALRDSDDALTESLTRQAAYLKGVAPGFAAVGTFVRDSVAALGVDVTGVTLVDASGLSRENRVPPRVVADVLALALSDRPPAMRAVVGNLAVAGLSGTLADRFQAASARSAVGVFRGKTGTLTGVDALAGTVVTADGRLLVVDVLSNRPGAGAGTTAARAALDRVVAALASCGCRG
jgi:D-alanyl-D-alanine carboxypeptidase/D-alanyl-D-alanine-endopeptidase (penicillin-binding protein 4)